MAAYTPFRQAAKRRADQDRPLFGRAEAMIQLSALKQQVVMVHGTAGVGKSALMRAHVAKSQRCVWMDARGLDTLEQWLMACARALRSPLQPTEQAWVTTTSEQLKLVLKADRIEHLVVDHAQELLEDILPILQQWATEAGVSVLVGSRWRPPSYEGALVELSPWAVDGQGPAFWKGHPVIQILERHAYSAETTFTPAMRRILWAIAPYTQGLALSCDLLGARLNMFNAESLLERLEAGRSWAITRTLSVALESTWQLLDDAQRHVLITCAQWVVAPSIELIEASVTRRELDVVEILDALKRHALVRIERTGPQVHVHVMPGVQELAWLQPEAQAARAPKARALALHCQELFMQAKGFMWQQATQPLWPMRRDIEQAWAWAREALEEAQAGEEPLQTRRSLAMTLARLTLGMGLVIRHDGDFPSFHALWTTRDRLRLDDLCDPAMRDWLEVLWFDSARNAHQAPGYQRLLDAMDRARERADDVTELGCCVRLAQSLFMSTDAVAQRLDEVNKRALKLADKLDDNLSRHRILSGHGLHAARQHDMVRAIALSKEAAQLAHHMEDWRGEAKSLLTMGFCHHALGQHDTVPALMNKAVEGFERAHDLIGLTHTLENIAWMSIDEGRLEDTIKAVERLEPLSVRLGLKWLFGLISVLKGQIALEQGRYLDAAIDFERAATDLHGGPRLAVLAAASYFQSLAYLLDDNPEQAQQSFERAFSFFEKMDNPEVRARLLSAKAFWMTRQGQLTQVKQLLERAREHEREQNPVIGHTIDVHQCLVDLTLMNQALAAQKMKGVRKHQTQLLSTLSKLLRSPTQDPHHAPIYKDMTLRMSFRVLQGMLPDWLRNMVAIELKDPNATALLIDRARRTFRPPGASKWVDMSARVTPFSLLDVLVQRRLDAPGEPIDSLDLYAQVWVGEEVGVESSTNRLYVTIAALRRAGLKPLIVSERGGYMLDTGVEIILADDQGLEAASKHPLV